MSTATGHTAVLSDAGSAATRAGTAERRSLIEALGDFSRLSRAAEALDVKGHTRLQIAIVTRLRRHGPARLTALAEDLAADLSVISRQAAHLASAGLIDRTRDPKDGRAWMLTLTPAGDDLVTEVRQRRDEWLAAALTYWDAAQVAEAATIVRTIVTAIQCEPGRGADPHAGDRHPGDPPATPATPTR